MPFLAELDVEDVPQHERDRVLIEDEELHLLAKAHVLEPFFLPLSRVFVILWEAV